MIALSEAHKQEIQREFSRFSALIDKYNKSAPLIEYGYFDGWHLSAFWRNENALVNFVCYRVGSELRAYKEDDSEWMEIDEARREAWIERNGQREKLEPVITEESIRLAFAWLYAETK